MTEFQSAEFDDELLSAYLDDELAAEERARVEERLAADPQSRQLLEELKAVSRAMKELPAATLDADLSESVLRRAERAMLESGERVSPRGLSEGMWRIPFGRSKRSWFWAGAALAAGLLLMVYEGRVKQEERLPNEVALDRRESVVERELTTRLEVRSVDEVRENLDDFAAEPPLVLSAPRAASAPESEALALREDASSARRGPAVDMDAAKELDAAVAVAGDDLVVVHVNATPKAIQDRAFDAVLFNRQIEVEKSADDESQAAAPGDVDVVLVEAAPAQIAACLADLDADKKNYLDIEVEEQSASKQRARAVTESAESLQKYNRGVVPPRQKIAFAPNRNFYYESAREQSEIAGTLADKQEAAPQAPDLLSRSGANSGRAMRIDAGANADRYSGRPATAAPMGTLGAGGIGGAKLPATDLPARPSSESLRYYSETPQNYARRAVQKLATKADMLQVLFVLSAEQPPTSSPAEPPPTPTPPTDDSVR